MLRGLAVLGILAVNAVAFAWPIDIADERGGAPFALTGANGVGHWVGESSSTTSSGPCSPCCSGCRSFWSAATGRTRRGERCCAAPPAVAAGVRRGPRPGLLVRRHPAALCLLRASSMMMMRAGRRSGCLWIGGGITLFWACVAGRLCRCLLANLSAEIRRGNEAGQPQAPLADVTAMVEAIRTSALVPLRER